MTPIDKPTREERTFLGELRVLKHLYDRGESRALSYLSDHLVNHAEEIAALVEAAKKSHPEHIPGCICCKPVRAALERLDAKTREGG